MTGTLVTDSPLAKLFATEFGNLPETQRLREIFTAYASELFDSDVDQLGEREINAAFRAFLPYIVEEVGGYERQYVIPVEWASAMTSDNPGFIADDKEREYYLDWIGYLVVQGGRNLFALDANKVGPVFLSSVIDVYLPGVLDTLTPADTLPDGAGNLYWCQSVNLRFVSHDC